MSRESGDTRCPFCGGDSGIERVGTLMLPGGLYLDEFEILVRNEWRGLLGSEAYGRAHEVRIIRALAAFSMAPADVDGTYVLAREIESVLADLAAAGRGRPAVRREVRKLFKAVRTVLTCAGARPAEVEVFVATARRGLDRALDYPTPATSPV